MEVSQWILAMLQDFPTPAGLDSNTKASEMSSIPESDRGKSGVADDSGSGSDSLSSFEPSDDTNFLSSSDVGVNPGTLEGIRSRMPASTARNFDVVVRAMVRVKEVADSAGLKLTGDPATDSVRLFNAIQLLDLHEGSSEYEPSSFDPEISSQGYGSPGKTVIDIPTGDASDSVQGGEASILDESGDDSWLEERSMAHTTLDSDGHENDEEANPSSSRSSKGVDPLIALE